MSREGEKEPVFSEEEFKLIKLYGRLPSKKNLLGNKLKERKYFDSGDYALSRAGKDEPGIQIGQAHPTPENIPHHMTSPSHSSTSSAGASVSSGSFTVGSPMKEPSLLHTSNVAPTIEFNPVKSNKDERK